MNTKAGIKKEFLFATALVVLILIGGITIYHTRDTGEDSSSTGKPSRPAVTVELLTVHPEPIEDNVAAVGTILSNESVMIKPEVAGKIVAIGFDEGEKVQKGKELFRLDTDLIQAQYQEGKANFDFAKAQYDRAKDLLKKQVTSQEAYDDAYRQYLNAKARLNTLATTIRKHHIEAPFDGRLGSRKVSIGDYVAVGDDLVALEDLAMVKAEFYLPERYIRKIYPGQRIRVTVESVASVFEGEIYLIDPRINLETRSAIIRARVPNPDEIIKPGMFCMVTVITATKQNALMVPEESLFSRGYSKFLYVVQDDKAEQRQVTTGIFADGRVEILSGLKTAEQVITAGIQKIGPGTPVQGFKETTGKNTQAKSRETQPAQ